MRHVTLLTLALFATLAALGCRSGDAPAPATKAAATPASTDPWADDTPRELPPPKVTYPFEHPFVWAATRDGKTTYLFGTVHGGVNAEHRIPRWVWDYFDHATTLIEEANLQDLDLIEWTVRPDGSPTLHQELGDAYWAKLEAMVTPMMAGFLDTQATAVAALRVSGHGGKVRDTAAGPMDGELLVRAQGLKKTITFLETGKFQSALFGELFDLATLKRLLDRTDALAPLNRQFLDAYVEGDETRFLEIARAQMAVQAADDDAGAAHLIDRLLLARNRSWIPALEKAHAAGGAFVAVGALHLVGEGSVVELLRARGFTVERATH
jgi:uncharacterized protein YbaP (TraB family)